MIYFDHAATSSPKPPAVVEAVAGSLREGYGNAGRGVHRASRGAADRIEQARADVAAFIGARDAARVAFTLNATDALNGAIAGLLSRRPGAVVVTPLEHNAVMRPLRALRARGSCTDIRVAPLDDGHRLTTAALLPLLTDDVRLVVVSHVSNVTGTAQDVSTLAATCRQHGVPLLVDASQSVGVLDLDVSALDLVAFSGHKSLYGPSGVGVLYVGDGVDLPPWRCGGTGGYASDRPTQPDELPWRLEAGTLPAPAICGLAAGVAFVRAWGVAQVRRHHLDLAERLMARLAALDTVEVLAPSPDVALVSFHLRGWAPLDVARVLDDTFGIAVGAGLSCAPDAHAHLGTLPAGAVRVSAGLHNTEADIDALGEALGRLAEMDIYTA